MTQLVPVLLVGWIALGPILFWLLKPRTAVLVIAVGGFLFLPVAMFDPARDQGVNLPYWIMPTALPSQFWLTKATAVGLSLLLGILLREPRAILRARWKAWDLLAAGWCLCPVLSGFARGLAMAQIGALTVYQCLTWGVPYAVGRIYFSDAEALEQLADAFMIGGLINVPICLIEWLTGPKLYGWVYGFHPYSQDGVPRYIFSRPLGFFELGNQLGVYLASVALLAVWLATHGRKRRIAGIPFRLAAIMLVLLAFLTQSVGAILLAAGALGLMFLVQRLKRLWPLGALAAAIALPVLLLAGVVITHRTGMEAALYRVAMPVVEAMDSLDRHSLAWRLKRDEIHLPAAMRHPITGSAAWNWWDAPERTLLERNAAARPWDLPLLVLGMYGIAGLVLWLAVMIVPGLLGVRLVDPRFWRLESSATPVAFCGVLGVMFLDSLMNSPVFLPILLASGGLMHLRLSAPRESRS